MSRPDEMAAAAARTAPGGVTIALRPERVFRALLAVIATLLLVGTVATSLSYLVASGPEDRLARAAARFSLSEEPNLLNFYSALVLAACAAGLVVVAIAERRSGGRETRGWMLLTVLLSLLAVDEAVMLHEMANRTLQQVLHTGGLLTFAWVLPAGVFAALVFFVFLGFLRRIDGATSRRFVFGGALVVIGALGMEMIAGVISERWGFYSVPHIAEQIAEEGLEMTGGLVFLYGVLDHIRRRVGTIRLGAPEVER